MQRFQRWHNKSLIQLQLMLQTLTDNSLRQSAGSRLNHLPSTALTESIWLIANSLKNRKAFKSKMMEVTSKTLISMEIWMRIQNFNRIKNQWTKVISLIIQRPRLKSFQHTCQIFMVTHFQKDSSFLRKTMSKLFSLKMRPKSMKRSSAY